MTLLLATIAVFLLLNIFVGMVRLVRGPTPADRMLAVQLFGTTGVGLLVLLAELTAEPLLQNVALVFALFAVMAIVAFTRRVMVVEVEAES